MITIEVEAARVHAAFLDLVRRISSGLRGSWSQVGARAVSTTITVTPVQSGRLVATLKASEGAGGIEIKAGGGSVVYAGVQNFGWPRRNIAAQRFMDAAAETIATEAPDELGSEIQSLIDRVGLR